MSCFLLSTVANNAAVSIDEQIFIQILAFSSLENMPRSGIAGSNINSMFHFFFFWGATILFSNVTFFLNLEITPFYATVLYVLHLTLTGLRSRFCQYILAHPHCFDPSPCILRILISEPLFLSCSWATPPTSCKRAPFLWKPTPSAFGLWRKPVGGGIA